MKIPERLVPILKSAGWAPERKFDTSIYEQEWTRLKYPIYKPAMEFLQCLGGLSVRPPSFAGYASFGCDPVQPAADVSPESQDSWDEIAEDRLVPIGYYSGGPQTVLVSSTGGFYGAFTDNELNILGSSVDEFLDRLCWEPNP